MLPQMGGQRLGECSVDIPPYSEEVSKVSKVFSEDSRCPSQSSSLNSNSGDICRICHCEGAPDQPLITPCYCAGSLRYVHQTCLQQWIKSSNIRCCELCKFQFIMQTKVKPFNEWEYLEMSGLERKKLLCAMLFHIIAMTCVCWSLYVLIDRTLDEVRRGHLEWPFWTKLIVVGIGFMGGIVFMYIQCRAYFVLCKRWKAYNRVIFVQNAPDKAAASSQTAKLLSGACDRDTGPSSSCTFRNYSDTCKRDDHPAETSCIDIKGVRNLHIIFGDENQIRFHHDNRGEKRALTHDEESKNLEEKSSGGNGHSVHIQIGGGTSDRACSINSTTNNKSSCEKKNSCEGALCASGGDCKLDPNSGGKKSDQSVVKLQFKKAEIVIEFGKNNSESRRMKLLKGKIDEPDSDAVFSKSTLWDDLELGASPKRRFSLEEQLDLETKYVDRIANETSELPTGQLLINDRGQKMSPAIVWEKNLVKDWRSSEDVASVKSASTRF